MITAIGRKKKFIPVKMLRMPVVYADGEIPDVADRELTGVAEHQFAESDMMTQIPITAMM